MRLLVTMEQRCLRSPDGAIYSPGGRGLAFWAKHYLWAFDELTVVARVRDTDQPVERLQRADGPRVRFVALPTYVGPWQYLVRRAEVRRVLRRAVDEAEAICLRVPSIIAAEAFRAARARGRPVGLEVIGDPWHVFDPRVTRFLGRALVRRRMSAQLRRQCREAAAVSYVTRRFLQSGYPPGPETFAIGLADDSLGPEDYVPVARTYDGPARRLIAVGSFAFDYKGFNYLLPALAMLPPARRPELTILGDGRLLPRYRALAAELGLVDRVRFAGRVPAGEAVRRALDAADVFVMPSLTEGLPRAMIEAMARALPCIGSAVGGIPELLEPQDLVPPADAGALAARLAEVLEDPARLSRMSARNLDAARGFAADVLEPQRAAFFDALRSRTQAWLDRQRR